MAIPGLAARAAVVFVALMTLAGCGENHVWRQKTIIEVETPNGIVTGGSVVEVSVHWFGTIEKALTAGNGVSSAGIGEASFVEVAPGKYLFALSLTEPLERTLESFRSPPEEKNQPLTARLETIRERRVLTWDKYPKLVTFDEINDPKTVKLVDPANLAATFGAGFALKSISIEITDEKVTEGNMEKVLVWLCDYKARHARLNGSTSIAISDNELSNRLGTGSFKHGECK